MKPTIQFNERKGDPRPMTDYSYQAPRFSSQGGHGSGSRRASIRAISHDYFKNEARSSFATEAAFFSVIVLTAAVPVINSAIALGHLVRSIGAL
jgi:hypothetical protein